MMINIITTICLVCCSCGSPSAPQQTHRPKLNNPPPPFHSLTHPADSLSQKQDPVSMVPHRFRFKPATWVQAHHTCISSCISFDHVSLCEELDPPGVGLREMSAWRCAAPPGPGVQTPGVILGTLQPQTEAGPRRNKPPSALAESLLRNQQSVPINNLFQFLLVKN